MPRFPLSPLRPAPLALAVSLVFAFSATSACAQSTGAALPAAPVAYNIAAKPLGQALGDWALQTGMQLIVQPSLVSGKSAPVLSGKLAPQQALNRLLEGSGLSARVDGSAVIIQDAGAAGSAEKLMPGVTVSAQGEADGRTDGTGSYTATGPGSTATGLALTLRETPQSVTLMTRQRMDDFNLRTLAEVLEQTPGLNIDHQGDANNFQVRGTAVNLQVDGVRQISGGWQTDSQKLYAQDDMVEIDHVEVLKGSSGLVNGDGKYGGTINLVRKRATRQFQGSASASAGSWSNYRAEADLGGPLSAAGTVRGRIVAAAADGKGFRDGVKHNNQTLFGTIEVDLAPETVLTAGLTYREREYYGAGDTSMIQAYAANGQYLGLKPRSFNVGAPWSGYKQQSTTAFSTLEHRFASGWKARLTVNHDKVELPRSEMGIWWTVIPQAVDVARSERYVNRNRTLAFNLAGTVDLFGRTHDLMLGADAARFSSDAYSGSDRLSNLGLDYAGGGGAIVRPDLDSLELDNLSYFSSKRRSLFATGRFSLADRVKLISGARVTDYQQFDLTPYASSNNNMKEDGVVTPYAGLVVDVHRNVSLYGSYTRIFTVQSAKDAQGHTLAPEEGLTYEAGAKGEFFDKRLNLGLARFWMNTDNTAQSTGQSTPDGQAIYRAVNGVSRRGYELEMSGELAPGWQAQGSYVLNSSNLNDASNTPKTQFKLASTYRFQSVAQGLTVGASTRWQSKTSARLLDQPAFWLVDLMARYQITPQLSVSANLNNLFDKSYFSGLRNFGRVQYTWGAPRSASLNLRYQF